MVYEFVPPDPANEKNVKQELERGFDILFDFVLKATSDALELRKMSKQNKVFSTQEPILDSSVRLGIR